MTAPVRIPLNRLASMMASGRAVSASLRIMSRMERGKPCFEGLWMLEPYHLFPQAWKRPPR